MCMRLAQSVSSFYYDNVERLGGPEGNTIIH